MCNHFHEKEKCIYMHKNVVSIYTKILTFTFLVLGGLWVFFSSIWFYFCDKYAFHTKREKEGSCFPWKQKSSPAVGGDAAEALVVGIVPGWPARVQRWSPVSTSGTEFRSVSLCVGGRGCRWMSVELFTNPLASTQNPSIGWPMAFLSEQEIIWFLSCTPSYQQVNIQYKHRDSKITFNLCVGIFCYIILKLHSPPVDFCSKNDMRCDDGVVQRIFGSKVRVCFAWS